MNVPASSSDVAQDSWLQSSTCRAVEEAGQAAGRAYGLAESVSRTLALLLRRQARQKFAGPDKAGRAMLDALARGFATEQLGELGERLVGSASWSEWLVGVVAPPPAEDMPAYTKGLEMDLEPSGPSIDTYLAVGSPAGDRTFVHIRIQKSYQPDLDRILFEASRKFERKHGQMPTVAVFLMRPPADGPGVTGRFEEHDANGKVTHVFTYTIRKAWESTAEELTKGPGTMMMAPLSKGARERMPEIVRLIEQGLERNQADAETRERAWSAVYWSMGFICDIDETHRVLGNRVPLIHAGQDYLNAKGQAFLEAYSAVQQEGRRQAGRDLVLRQATRRFGPDAKRRRDDRVHRGAERSRGARRTRLDRRRLAVAAGEVLTIEWLARRLRTRHGLPEFIELQGDGRRTSTSVQKTPEDSEGQGEQAKIGPECCARDGTDEHPEVGNQDDGRWHSDHTNRQAGEQSPHGPEYRLHRPAADDGEDHPEQSQLDTPRHHRRDGPDDPTALHPDTRPHHGTQGRPDDGHPANPPAERRKRSGRWGEGGEGRWGHVGPRSGKALNIRNQV